jgi:hypothetical protein
MHYSYNTLQFLLVLSCYNTKIINVKAINCKLDLSTKEMTSNVKESTDNFEKLKSVFSKLAKTENLKGEM